MSTTGTNQMITGEIWHMIEKTNTAREQSQNTQKKGQAQIAATNRSTAGELLVLDSVLSALADGEASGATATRQSDTSAKPQLPFPGYNSSIFDGTGKQETGLITIIGNVLAMQARSNSNFWQTLWTQASDSMQIQVDFAPIVGQAIENQYQQQSNATQQQASQAFTDAFISLGMFAATAVTAGAMEYSDSLEETGITQKPNEFARETDVRPQTNNELSDEAGTTINDDETNGGRISRDLDHYGAIAKSGLKKAASWLGRGLQVAQLTGMLSQFGTGLNDSKYQSNQAEAEKAEGLAAAKSQEGQMESQFYSQDFSRMEELRQGSSQNIDNAMNILQQAANTITQTTTSMFRG